MLRWLEKDMFYREASPIGKLVYKGAMGVVIILIGCLILLCISMIDDVYYPSGDRWQNIFDSAAERAELRRLGNINADNLRFLEKFGKLRIAACPDPEVWHTFSEADRERYYELKTSFGLDARWGYGKKINDMGCVTSSAR